MKVLTDHPSLENEVMEIWNEEAKRVEADWKSDRPEFPVRVVAQESCFDSRQKVVLLSFHFDPKLEIEQWGTGVMATTDPSEVAGGTDNLWEYINVPIGWTHVNYCQGEGVETFVFVPEGSPADLLYQIEVAQGNQGFFIEELKKSETGIERTQGWRSTEDLRKGLAELQKRITVARNQLLKSIS